MKGMTLWTSRNFQMHWYESLGYYDIMGGYYEGVIMTL